MELDEYLKKLRLSNMKANKIAYEVFETRNTAFDVSLMKCFKNKMHMITSHIISYERTKAFSWVLIFVNGYLVIRVISMCLLRERTAFLSRKTIGWVDYLLTSGEL